MSVPEAKIICDSMGPTGHRLTTMEVKLHRFVLAELNTHRVFSRNSASSRAIPTKKLLERVKTDPAIPVWWGKNEPGMSAREELDEPQKTVALGQWLLTRDYAVQTVEMLSALGVHKQIVNRLLEPWMWHHVIITSTEWTNFFSQRCHPDAQPEMRAAAMAMQVAYYTSTPKLLSYGEWHLPYTDGSEPSMLMAKGISVARCARVSYLTHEGVRDVNKDLELYAKLASAVPMHASPFEHVATPKYGTMPQTGNLVGWNQFRHSFNNESIKSFVPNHPDLQDYWIPCGGSGSRGCEIQTLPGGVNLGEEFDKEYFNKERH